MHMIGSALDLILTCICTLKHCCLPNLHFVGNFCSAFRLFMKLPGDLYALTCLIAPMNLHKLLVLHGRQPKAESPGAAAGSGGFPSTSGSIGVFCTLTTMHKAALLHTSLCNKSQQFALIYPNCQILLCSWSAQFSEKGGMAAQEG